MKFVFIFLFITFFSSRAEQKEHNTFLNKVKEVVFDETYKDDKKFKRHRVEVEGGVANTLYNKIGTNSSTKDLFDTNDLNSSSLPYFRISYYFKLDKKNEFKLMIAPFSTSGTGNLKDSFTYRGDAFSSGQASYRYKFNSYRGTYRRTIFENEKFTFKLGLTLKIRDAMVELSQGNVKNSNSNVGVVPLAHVNFEYRPVKDFTFVLESDLAAAPQGRAFDVAVSIKYDISDYLDFSIGYRFLEGGASTLSVYNSAFINFYFASIGVKI